MGEARYSRSVGARVAGVGNCGRFRDADAAQRAFLAGGGPERDRLDDFGQELAGAADEWLALDVFIRSRRFSHEHQVRRGIPDAEYNLVPAETVQLAPRAVAEIDADDSQAIHGRLTGRGGPGDGGRRARRRR